MSDTFTQLKAIGTTTVSDALDKLGIIGGVYGVKPLSGGQVICGPAFTVRYEAQGSGEGTVGDFIDDVPAGAVIVIDNKGRTDCTVWGDILSRFAKKAGIEGTVIDGACRDVGGIRNSGYSVFSRDYTMVTGKDRVCMDATQVPVALSGIRVEPGAIILGDDTGVVVVPAEKVEEVTEAATRIAHHEHKIAKLVDEGAPLREARAATNYHILQSKQTN